MGPDLITMKLKPLLPTLRERKRYLAFEVLADKELSWHAIKQAIVTGVRDYIGMYGLAEAGLLFVKYNKNKGVLRVSHTMLNKVRAAFMFISVIDATPVIIKSIKASGMLNKTVNYIQ